MFVYKSQKWENIIKKCVFLVYDVSVDVSKKCIAKGYFNTAHKENTVCRKELEY